MKVIVKNTYHFDLIECQDSLVNKLAQYQTEFDEWALVHDQIVNLETFVEWVNNNYLKDSCQKIKIICRGIEELTDSQKKLPYIYY